MKDKGFTLVELLAALVILALLIFVGTMTVSNIFDNTKDNYYHSLENTLSIAGNEYFNDNREDRPIDDYNFVDMDTLVEHEYMDELTTYDGKDKCKSDTGVYIYNENSENKYEVCLVCGEYKSEGEYCNGKKAGTIHITGNVNDKNGPSYNPLLSYSGTKWINASNVWIHFSLVDEGVNVSKYTIYNANGNSKIGDCTASGNKCSMRFDKTGSYYVEAFDGNNKVGNRKYFNVKLDNTPPTMDLKNLETEFLLDNDKIVFDYENEVININDDNGYKEVKYTLIRYNPKGNEEIVKDKDIKDADFKIKESLQSGKYDLYITVTDFAGNIATQRNTHITFYIRYNVDLQYFDNKDNRHDAGRIKVYTYGKYDKLPDRVKVNSNPQEVSWYLNANMVGNITTTSTPVEKIGYHVLYGKEAKFKSSFNITCNDITYDTNYHQLATVPIDEQGKYRLMVYYGGTLMSNEAKDARNYTIIAMLNPGYTWDDGSTKAKAKQCEILPKRVPRPTCDDKTYNGSDQQIVKPVDASGNYSVYAGEIAYSLGQRPIGRSATTYSFTATLNDSKNYAWKNATTNIFNNETLNCKINPKEIPFNYQCCQNCVFDGTPLDLVTGFDLEDQGVEDDQGLKGLIYYDDIDDDSMSEDDYQDLMYRISSTAQSGNVGDPAYGSGTGVPVFSVNPFSATNADTYKVEFKIHNDNYVFAGGGKTKTLSCTISPASFKIEWDKVEFKYDGEKHVATLSEKTISALEEDPLDGGGAFYASIKYRIDGEKTDPGDSYTAKFVCSSISDYNDNSALTKGCSNVNFSNTTVEFEIVDKEKPSCSMSVSSSGKVTVSGSDDHAISKIGINGKGGLLGCSSKTGEYTLDVNSGGKYTGEIIDCSGNKGTCSITVKKVQQYRTQSCNSYSYGTNCNDWSDYGGCNYYSDISDNLTSCRACGNGSKYECKTRTCSSYRNGCTSWSGWTTWADTSSTCSSVVSSDYSTNTDCQFVYRKG